MKQKQLSRYRNRFHGLESWNTVAAAIPGRLWAVIAIFAVAGVLLVMRSQAATSTVSTEAESGSAAGNAAIGVLTGASAGSGVTFGGGSASGTPAGLKAFVGGDSIALVWRPVKAGGIDVTSYNVYRDGTKVATTAADPNSGGARLGSQYIDKTVTAGQSYSYEVQAVLGGGQTSAKSAAVSASRPSATTPVPTVTIDPSLAQYNAKANAWYQQYGSDIIKTWYPKISSVIAYPDYTPVSQITVKSIPQAEYDTRFGDTGRSGVVELATNSIIISPKAADPANEFSLEAVNNASRILQGTRFNISSWSFTAIADYATFNIYNNCPTFDCRTVSADRYFYDRQAGVGHLFYDWIQNKYDPTYIRKANIASHNKTYDYRFMEFSDGNNIDQAWALFSKQQTRTGVIKNKTTADLCMDRPDGSLDTSVNSLDLRLWPCNNSVAQKITPRTIPGTSNVVLSMLGYCLYADSTVEMATIGLSECKHVNVDGFIDVWVINSNGTISGAGTNKCLTAPNSSPRAGNWVYLQDCDSSKIFHQWTLP